MHFRHLHQQFDLRNDAEKMRASDSSRLSNMQNTIFESTCKRAGLTESNVRRMSVILRDHTARKSTDNSRFNVDMQARKRRVELYYMQILRERFLWNVRVWHMLFHFILCHCMLCRIASLCVKVDDMTSRMIWLFSELWQRWQILWAMTSEVSCMILWQF